MILVDVVLSFLASVGRSTLTLLRAAGRVVLFALAILSHLFRPPYFPGEFGRQILVIGYFSLPVVGLTALFTGAALALQIYAGGARFSAETAAWTATALPTTPAAAMPTRSAFASIPNCLMLVSRL